MGLAMNPNDDDAILRATSGLPTGAQLVPLRRIDAPAGAVMHGLKASEPAFQGFGEAYFTTIGKGQVKAWKRHRRMVSNLIVPVGEIRLKLFDDRADSPTRGQLFELTLGSGNYQRLTLSPGLWFGFEGLAEGLNLMLNLASIEHDPTESDALPQDDPRFGQSGW
jgi:dTDP-4-dehydrorhamnose 3,5-epimerase